MGAFSGPATVVPGQLAAIRRRRQRLSSLAQQMAKGRITPQQFKQEIGRQRDMLPPRPKPKKTLLGMLQNPARAAEYRAFTKINRPQTR